ncbi:MAG: epoxyqueuosine reductase QueH [Oscillospiraceae bacterium]|nr:epoxyqueuosine reductase QueH [Oscillospiraceae bacterium]
MNKRNYSAEMDKIAGSIGEKRPSVLLHSCCGPCSSSVLERLTADFDVTILWYNPNLYPEAEYGKRLDALLELLEKNGMKDRVHVLVEPWRSEEYRERIKGMEKEPEGGKRCEQCFLLRLSVTARTAAEKGFDFFCTTLTVSRYKNAPLINELGEAAGREAGVKWLPSDFKKQGGEQRSQELSREYGIYRQDYCGCEFSLKARKEHDPNE